MNGGQFVLGVLYILCSSNNTRIPSGPHRGCVARPEKRGTVYHEIYAITRLGMFGVRSIAQTESGACT